MKIGRSRSVETEAALKQRIHDHLDDLDICWYLCAAGAFGKVGDPDCIACIDGKILCIEGKIPGGKIRGAQEECRKETEMSGGKFIYAYSLEDVDKAIEELKN